MADFISENGQSRLTRRGALKRLGLGTAAVTTELGFRPIGNFIDWAAKNGWLQEGHPAQRAARAEYIAHLIALDPHNQEKKDLLTSWIKFNGAELYANTYEMPLTAKTIRHFLYGDGRTIDVSRDFERSLLMESNTWITHPSERNVPALVTGMINKILNIGPGTEHLAEPYQFKVNKREYAAALQTNRAIPIDIELVSFASFDQRDLRNSLNQHTFYVRGMQENAKIKKGIIPEAPDFYELTIRNPEVTFYDRYDWEANNAFGGQGSIGEFVDGFVRQLPGIDRGTNLISLIGNERWDKLHDIKVRIDDKEGAMLTRYGVGTEFDVRGKLNVGDTIILKVSVPTMEKVLAK